MGFFYNKITSCDNDNIIDPSVLENYQTKTDSNLKTSDKTIVGAINSTKTQIDNANTQISDANAQINNTNNQINSINTQISNINTQINSTISEADINTIINNALK